MLLLTLAICGITDAKCDRPKCFKALLGNGICNQECNVKACGWDNGDCHSQCQNDESAFQAYLRVQIGPHRFTCWTYKRRRKSRCRLSGMRKFCRRTCNGCETASATTPTTTATAEITNTATAARTAISRSTRKLKRRDKKRKKAKRKKERQTVATGSTTSQTPETASATTPTTTATAEITNTATAARTAFSRSTMRSKSRDNESQEAVRQEERQTVATGSTTSQTPEATSTSTSTTTATAETTNTVAATRTSISTSTTTSKSPDNESQEAARQEERQIVATASPTSQTPGAQVGCETTALGETCAKCSGQENVNCLSRNGAGTCSKNGRCTTDNTHAMFLTQRKSTEELATIVIAVVTCALVAIMALGAYWVKRKSVLHPIVPGGKTTGLQNTSVRKSCDKRSSRESNENSKRNDARSVDQIRAEAVLCQSIRVHNLDRVNNSWSSRRKPLE